MNIVVSGASGFIGSSVVKFLTEEGHRVVRLVRSQPKSDEVYWDLATGKLDAAGLDKMDGVVHLAGESIVGRWTAEKKKKIFESRVKGTTLLCGALARLVKKPRTLICASAIGYYGDRGEELLTEESVSGKGFLSEVCRAWEAATELAEKSGIRVVNLRFGMVLSSQGGALKKMLLPFKIGVGGKLGSGNQYMSWISLEDIVGIILYALRADILRGPVNAVAPNPVRNIEFTKTLGRVLKRPVLLPMPAAAARLIFGQMADELLLASARVKPARLLAANYPFRYPNLEEALREIIY